MERKCGNCALKALKNGMCPIFNANMEGEDGCPYFTSHLEYCEVCGSIIPKGGIIQEDKGEFHLMCNECATGHPCAACKSVRECRLQTDQSCPEPLYVMVQQRQGNMVVQSQQLNPKRVEATCAQGCVCFRKEGLEDGDFCWKQNGCGCNNHTYQWRNS